MIRQAGGAEHAVAFAAQKFRREPAVVPRRPEPDEFAHGIQIALVAKKLFRLFILRRAAEPRRHRINEHQVARVQRGKFIVHQRERRRRQRSVVVHLHAARPERAEMQPHRGRPRPAVETKHHGPRRRVRFIQPRVGHIKNRRARRAVGFQDRQHARLRRVSHAFARDGHRVRHAHRRVRGVGDFRTGENIGDGGRIGGGRFGGTR